MPQAKQGICRSSSALAAFTSLDENMGVLELQLIDANISIDSQKISKAQPKQSFTLNNYFVFMTQSKTQ